MRRKKNEHFFAQLQKDARINEHIEASGKRPGSKPITSAESFANDLMRESENNYLQHAHETWDSYYSLMQHWAASCLYCSRPSTVTDSASAQANVDKLFRTLDEEMATCLKGRKGETTDAQFRQFMKQVATFIDERTVATALHGWRFKYDDGVLKKIGIFLSQVSSLSESCDQKKSFMRAIYQEIDESSMSKGTVAEIVAAFRPFELLLNALLGKGNEKIIDVVYNAFTEEYTRRARLYDGFSVFPEKLGGVLNTMLGEPSVAPASSVSTPRNYSFPRNSSSGSQHTPFSPRAMTPSASPFPVRPLKASAIEHVTPPRLGDAVSSGAFVAPQARIMRQGSEAGEGVPANGAGTIARKGALIKHGDEARVPRGKRFVGVMDRVAEEEVEIGLAEPVSPDVPTAPTKASREETYKNFCASLIIGFKGYATKKRLSFQVSAFLENDIFPSIACSSDELSARLNEFYMDSGFEARADLVRSLQKSTTMIMNYLETIRVMKDGQDCTDIIKKNCIKMSNIFEER